MTQFCIHYFKEYQETCKNLVPVERVVYYVLSNVQKKFSRDLLKVIFSKTHLKVYPDLKETLKHFFLNGNYSSHLLQGRKDNFILFFFFSEAAFLCVVLAVLERSEDRRVGKECWKVC